MYLSKRNFPEKKDIKKESEKPKSCLILDTFSALEYYLDLRSSSNGEIFTQFLKKSKLNKINTKVCIQP